MFEPNLLLFSLLFDTSRPLCFYSQGNSKSRQQEFGKRTNSLPPTKAGTGSISSPLCLTVRLKYMLTQIRNHHGRTAKQYNVPEGNMAIKSLRIVYTLWPVSLLLGMDPRKTNYMWAKTQYPQWRAPEHTPGHSSHWRCSTPTTAPHKSTSAHTTLQVTHLSPSLISSGQGESGATCLCCCSVAKQCLTLRNPMDCRLPCPSPPPRVCSDSCPSSQWCHPTVSSSATAFSFCFQSFPASGPFPMSHLFVANLPKGTLKGKEPGWNPADPRVPVLPPK